MTGVSTDDIVEYPAVREIHREMGRGRTSVLIYNHQIESAQLCGGRGAPASALRNKSDTLTKRIEKTSCTMEETENSCICQKSGKRTTLTNDHAVAPRQYMLLQWIRTMGWNTQPRQANNGDHQEKKRQRKKEAKRKRKKRNKKRRKRKKEKEKQRKREKRKRKKDRKKRIEKKTKGKEKKE